MMIYRSIDEILEPLIEEVIEELKAKQDPYDGVLNRWMDLVRKTVYNATLEYNPYYCPEGDSHE